MTDRATTSSWLRPIVDRVDEHRRQGGFIIDLEEYRPDLVRAMAHALKFRFLDYRGEVMSKLGWQAHTLSLGEVKKNLETQSIDAGLVAFNVEALMGTKPQAERSQWLTRFLTTRFIHPVVLPLCIFRDESLRSNSRYYAVPPESLPQQSFLNRLAM